MAHVQYETVVEWDAELADVGFADADNGDTLKGLAISALKITAGIPAATAGHWLPAAVVKNVITGIIYQNTGSTASPTWSVMENSGIFPASSLAYNSDATAGPLTIPAAKMVDAILDRNGGAADRTDVTDTAANIVAAISGAVVGSVFYFYLRNISATAGEKITVTGGAGVTMSGNAIIFQNGEREFVGRVTNATPGVEAVTIYGVTLAQPQDMTLANGKMIIGNGSNVATPVTPSGDATVSNAGVISLSKLKMVQVTLTNAQVLALNGTPIQVVAATGVASEAIIPVKATMAYTRAVASYATNTELDLIHSGSTNALLKTSIAGAASTFAPFVDAVSATPSGNVFIANADLNVFVPTGNPTGGNAGSSIKVTVFYAIMTVL